MKILVIFGSARRKNSFLVTKQFETALQKLADYNFEYIFLNKVDLKICKGCHVCLFYGEEKCPLNDIAADIFSKMLEADGIIFVSPVYVSQVTGLMKNFIDRFSFLCHRPQLYHQHSMIISTTGVMDLKSVLNYLEKVSLMWGMRSVTKLGIVTPPDKEKKEITGDKRIIKTARQFHKQMKAENWSPKLSQLIQFRAQKTFLTSEKIKEFSPRDFQYYSQIKKQSYHIPVKINIFKRLISWLVEKMIQFQVKKRKNKVT
ncbi:MAG: NAD(P)H-dependent oxidoreductase [Candidatus Cloacimonetes bacterium]|nr:NAD(P)H-dependent oxidoreductase [Candidatus Cloacimonadota bacterium]MCF7814718.1 NAD(P)H-dependent oxidoreductase [Candidatus Cloacimonadota bacterium]MCF7869141.1 NAD(P)H-dependent oxidoreductase [Candidatus Cloacimonadota bacterium]MCF7884590.1 NAD(P)H-dependent oxidoreductase [Candidatus Cloacimonadota bacterium]